MPAFTIKEQVLAMGFFSSKHVVTSAEEEWELVHHYLATLLLHPDRKLADLDDIKISRKQPIHVDGKDVQLDHSFLIKMKNGIPNIEMEHHTSELPKTQSRSRAAL